MPEQVSIATRFVERFVQCRERRRHLALISLRQTEKEETGQQQKAVAQLGSELHRFVYRRYRERIFRLEEVQTSAPRQTTAQTRLVIQFSRRRNRFIQQLLRLLELAVATMLETHQKYRVYFKLFASGLLCDFERFVCTRHHFVEAMREEQRHRECVERGRLKLERIQHARLVQHVAEVFGRLREIAQGVIHRAALVIKRHEFFRLILGRELFNEIQSTRVMLFSFGVTVEFCSVIAGVNQVFNRPRKIAALLEVESELSRNLRRALAVVTQQLFARLLVQHHSSLVDQIAVEKVLIERVRETIARRQRAVRQLFFTLDVDQTMTLRDAREGLFEIDLVDSKQFGYDTREKLSAFDACILQRATLFRI